MAAIPQAVTDAVSAALDTSYTQGKADQALTDAAALASVQASLDAANHTIALENQANADLQAAFDAYKASHPDDPSPVSSAVLGASLGEPLAVDQTLPAVRFYSASWTNKLQAAYIAGTRVFVVSTKDAAPTNMVAMVKAAPADVQFYLTVNHEPDDNIKDGTLSVATWGSKMNAFGHALAGFSNVRFGPIHNGSYGNAAWDTDSSACDKSLWTFWGMDRYCFGYEDPATQYAEGVAYAKSLGLPILIGETAAPAADAARQQTVATKSRAWALDPVNNVAVNCWWQSTDSTHGDLGFANAAVQHAFLG